MTIDPSLLLPVGKCHLLAGDTQIGRVRLRTAPLEAKTQKQVSCIYRPQKQEKRGRNYWEKSSFDSLLTQKNSKGIQSKFQKGGRLTSQETRKWVLHSDLSWISDVVLKMSDPAFCFYLLDLPELYKPQFLYQLCHALASQSSPVLNMLPVVHALLEQNVSILFYEVLVLLTSPFGAHINFSFYPTYTHQQRRTSEMLHQMQRFLHQDVVLDRDQKHTLIADLTRWVSRVSPFVRCLKENKRYLCSALCSLGIPPLHDSGMTIEEPSHCEVVLEYLCGADQEIDVWTMEQIQSFRTSRGLTFLDQVFLLRSPFLMTYAKKSPMHAQRVYRVLSTLCAVPIECRWTSFSIFIYERQTQEVVSHWFQSMTKETQEKFSQFLIQFADAEGVICCLCERLKELGFGSKKLWGQILYKIVETHRTDQAVLKRLGESLSIHARFDFYEAVCVEFETRFQLLSQPFMSNWSVLTRQKYFKKCCQKL